MKTRFFNIRKLGTKLLSSLALVSSFALSSFAQTNIANYTFSQSVGTYTPITGGTVFIAANTPFDQEISTAITIPSFNFGGTAVTTMYIAANGYVTFGAAPAGTNYTPLVTTTSSITGAVAGFAADLGYSAGNATTGATSEIKHGPDGNEYVIQYTDIKRWVSTNERVSFQIRLNTSNGQIKVVYGGPIVIGTDTRTPQVGIRGNSTTYLSNVNSLMIGNIPTGTTCDWTNAVTAYESSSVFYMANTNTAITPVAGLTYTWTPGTQAPVRTFSAVTAITTNTATMNFTAPSGAANYNVRYRILGACNWTSATGNPYTGTAITLTGLTPGATYQVQVQAVNGTASSIWSHIPNAAGTGNGYTTSGTFTTTPTCFVPTALNYNTVLNTSAVIKWNAPTTAIPANGYEYYVSTTNTAPTGSSTPTGTATDTFKLLTNLAPSTQYYVWVRSNCGTNDKSTWTSSVNFTTLPSCVVPTALTYVANSATNNGATIRWTKPVVIPANGYEYYVSTTNTAPTASTPPTGTATDSFKVITGLPPATLHYVWVRSNCGTSDKSTWTASSVTFTTLCGTPAPGATIASSSTNLCAGAPVNFSLTTVPTGPGLSYLWQSSLDGTNYVDITGATTSTFSTNATAVYYRCRVVCSGGPDTVYSTPVQLTYSNNITNATGAQRCGAGSVTLNAAANTGTVINWYDVANGGTVLGTGTSFTTPVIANTTSFYAEAAVVTQGPAAATIGSGALTGVSTSYNFTQGGFGGLKAQYIIRASELTTAGFTAGNITSLGFEFTAIGSNLSGFTIQMGSTTLNEFPTPISLAALTNTVYSTSLFTPVIGVNNLAFSSPYNWDGTSNLIISISWSNNNSLNSSSTIKYDSYTGNMSQMNRQDNQTAAYMLSLTGTQSSGSTRSTNRPMFILNNKPAVCASNRAEVTATINTAPAFTITDNKTVCNNGTTPLTVTSTQASYNNVTWSPATGLFTDAAATVPYVANTHAYTVYHKSNVIGSQDYIATAQNTTTLCGGIDTVKIQVIPPAITAVATPGSLCLSGSSKISINPSIPQTGELYQWQTSDDNVTFTNVGSVVMADTLATGNLTSTKYYRAIVKNSDSVTCFNSVSDTVIVYNPSVTGTTPATRCGMGTLTLGATASAGTTLKWYTSLTGGTAIGTGTSFTTPTISTTTSYYVGASTDNSGTVQLGAGAYTSNANTPTFSGTSPYAYHYGNYKHQILVTASELSALGVVPGPITSLGFDVATAGTPVANFNNFNISLIPTTLNALTATFATGGTNVFSATSVTPAVGINTYNFTTPFFWDGTSNLIVQTCYNNNNSGVVGSSAEVRYDSTSFVSHNIYRIDGTQNNVCGATAGNASNDGPLTQARPKMIFGYGLPCESVRQTVVATVTPAPAFDVTNDKTVCNNAVTTLTVTNGSSDYNHITWSPVTNLYTNAAATTAYTAGTHAATVYYKNATAGNTMITASAGNTTTNCANIDTVKIQTLPAAVTAKALPKVLCESGVATVNFTPSISQTGFTQQWSGSDDHITFTDINGATGNSYTTPTLTNTKYYRITIRNSDGATCITSTDTVKVLHPQITQTVAAERCGPGTLTLNATAVDGQPTWYATATSAAILGTGNSFNTPNITANTTYYVSANTGRPDSLVVGTGTTASSGTEGTSPYVYHYGNYKHQMLIRASELQALGLTAGNINSLAFDVATVGSSTVVFNNFNISLIPTTQTVTTATFATGGTNVFTGNVTPTAGWNTYNFNTPFYWDGTSNLIVQTCYNNNNSGVNASSAQVRYTTTSFVSHTVHRLDGTQNNMCSETTANSNVDGPTISKRPNIRFNFNNTCASPRTAVVATIKDVPTATLTPDGDINLCAGETQTLTASGSAGAYIWLRNNTVVTGQNSNTLAVTQAAPYNVIVTGGNGCTDTSAVANIIVVPKPVVNLGNDTAVCGNETLQLNAANPGATYEWSNNSTTQTIEVTTPGQYAVTVTDNFNCVTRDTINIIHLAFPVVDLGADTVICPSRPLTLDAANAGAAYAWNDGSATQTISVNQEGTYSVIVTNTASCVGTDTINVTLVAPIVNNGFDFEPLFNIQPGRVRFTPIDLNPNYTYSWDFGDGFTANDAVTEHDYMTTGNYVVKLTVSDGCAESTETLEIYVDRYTSVTRVKATDLVVKLYPNPTSSVLNVALESENTYINKLSIFNMIGQEVTTIVPQTKNTKQQSIQLNNLASGAYLIKIETDKGTVNRKFEFVK